MVVARSCACRPRRDRTRPTRWPSRSPTSTLPGLRGPLPKKRLQKLTHSDKIRPFETAFATFASIERPIV